MEEDDDDDDSSNRNNESYENPTVNIMGLNVSGKLIYYFKVYTLKHILNFFN